MEIQCFQRGLASQGPNQPVRARCVAEVRLRHRGISFEELGRIFPAGAPPLDFVFTLCDDAAAEECPYWPGQPMTAQWGLPDPAAVEGSEALKHLAFADTFRMLANRISIFCALPLKSLDKLSLQRRLDDIGKAMPEKDRS
jgi:arsenate reductase (thioredoxin)